MLLQYVRNLHIHAITGCLKSIYVEDWYLYAGIVTINIKSDVYARMERRLPPCLATSQLEADEVKK